MYIGKEYPYLWVRKGEIYTKCSINKEHPNLYSVYIPSEDKIGNYKEQDFIDLSDNRLVRMLCG